jgi:hypothetical protein
MTRTPRPSWGTAPDPVGGWLHRVSYVQAAGVTHSEFFRMESAARRYSSRVRELGGEPRHHKTRIGRWIEVHES